MQGGEHICPSTIQIHFSAEPHDRGGSKYTQRFEINKHLKLVGEKIFLRRVRGHQSRVGS